MLERERERERDRDRETERCRISLELLFLFLKGMTGALAPFSYLVVNRGNVCVFCKMFFSDKLDLIVATRAILCKTFYYIDSSVN